MQDFIQINKNNILKIGIKDENGKETGEHLEFDLESIEYPMLLSRCEEEHNKNVKFLKNQFIIIDKKQDAKGKKIFSKNEEDKLNALNEFYKKEIKALDLFLGAGGVKKLLNGRSPYFSMFDDISKYIEQIMPKLKTNSDEILKTIKEKYSIKKEDNILE